MTKKRSASADRSPEKQKSAVSLRYDAKKDRAPKVTAKGRGYVAEKIIELARANNIPIKEDPDLLQILSQVDLDREIPASVYRVVAEMLAFVYKVNDGYTQKTTPK